MSSELIVIVLLIMIILVFLCLVVYYIKNLLGKVSKLEEEQINDQSTITNLIEQINQNVDQLTTLNNEIKNIDIKTHSDAHESLDDLASAFEKFVSDTLITLNEVLDIAPKDLKDFKDKAQAELESLKRSTHRDIQSLKNNLLQSDAQKQVLEDHLTRAKIRYNESLAALKVDLEFLRAQLVSAKQENTFLKSTCTNDLKQQSSACVQRLTSISEENRKLKNDCNGQNASLQAAISELKQSSSDALQHQKQIETNLSQALLEATNNFIECNAKFKNQEKTITDQEQLINELQFQKGYSISSKDGRYLDYSAGFLEVSSTSRSIFSKDNDNKLYDCSTKKMILTKNHWSEKEPVPIVMKVSNDDFEKWTGFIFIANKIVTTKDINYGLSTNSLGQVFIQDLRSTDEASSVFWELKSVNCAEDT